MNDKSKLSSRFKKVDEKQVAAEKPAQFTLKKVSPDFETIKSELYDKIASIPVWFEYSRDEQKDLVKRFVCSKVEDGDEILEKLYAEINGFGAIDNLISQENVSAVFVNGTKSVYIEIAGKVLNTEIKLSNSELSFLLNVIPVKAPLATFKSGDLLFTVINSEISVEGVNITIRKQKSMTVQNLIKSGFMTDEIFEFLLNAINSKKNIVISGEIDSGKTTLLEVLINSVLKNKRCVLLEEFSQIDIKTDTVAKFVINRKSSDFDNLLAAVLKMNSEYILTDFNSPYMSQNVISTVRAASVDKALQCMISECMSLENLPEKYAKSKVLSAFDYIVQINKSADGSSKITSIVELTPARTAAMSVKSVLNI